MLDPNGQIDCNWCMVFMHDELKDGAKQINKKAAEAAFKHNVGFRNDSPHLHK